MKNIAVLGAGVSGMASAWYLAKMCPKTTQIHLIEKTLAFGGWIESVKKDGHLFETGPRTLRPVGDSGTATLDLVYRLGLEHSIIAVPRDSPAAKSRFVLQNGKLMKMPSSIGQYLNDSSHIFRGSLIKFLCEPFVARSGKTDESIHEFVSRRLGNTIAEKLISAIAHGIYAGDTKKLSVKSTFSFLWDSEQKHGSITRGILAPASATDPATIAQSKSLVFVERIKKFSLYSFKDGLQSLTDAIRKDLENAPNVTIYTGLECFSLEVTDSTCELKFGAHKLTVDHIISSIPATQLARLLPDVPQLSEIPSVDVAVVNLAFKGANILPVTGFGYLVPVSEKADILGTVFDSCAVEHQNTTDDSTRITIMLGGHQFDSKFGKACNDKQVFYDAALKSCREFLGIKQDPIASLVSIHRECIPQYHVGHFDKLRAIHQQWESSPKNISYVGSSYFGVSVNDCVYNAKLVCEALVQGRKLSGLEKSKL